MAFIRKDTDDYIQILIVKVVVDRSEVPSLLFALLLGRLPVNSRLGKCSVAMYRGRAEREPALVTVPFD
jgi:hypothetical protein